MRVVHDYYLHEEFKHHQIEKTGWLIASYTTTLVARKAGEEKVNHVKKEE